MPLFFRNFPVPIFMPGEDAVWLPRGDKEQATLCTVMNIVSDKENFVKGYSIVPKSGGASERLTFIALDELTIIPEQPYPDKG